MSEADNNSPFKEIVAIYWRSYGGWHALVRSPYVIVALVITMLFAFGWWDKNWWSGVLQVLPNIVGFSIGGYAIWLGFGDEKFKALVAGTKTASEVSPYMEVSATFCHFVIVQLLAIVFALGADSFNGFEGNQFALLRGIAGSLGFTWPEIAVVLRRVGAIIGIFLFAYALTAALAAVFAIFQMSQWFDIYRSKEEERKERCQQKHDKECGDSSADSNVTNS